MSTTTNLGLFKHDEVIEENKTIFDVRKSLSGNFDIIDTAVGKDRERLDLLEASNTIYNFKGKVDTLANLQSKAKTQGDAWYCEEDSTYYTYTTDWIPVNLNLKLGVIDELKAKTIKCLQEVETPTPKSGTSIDINDSAEAKIGELKISGNSKQETRKGYNKLPNYLSSQTINGVTVTVNKDKSITLNGTATAYFQLILLNTTDKPITLQNGTYTISYKNKPEGLNLVGTENGADVPYMVGASTTQSVTKTYTSETTITKVVSAVASGTVFNNLTVYPMIYGGTETKEYEQYGVSPGPEHSSEIESCGDNINIFDEELEQGDINNTSGVNQNNNTRIRSKNYIEIPANINKLRMIRSIATKGIGLRFYDKDKTFLKYIAGFDETANIIDFDIVENAKYFRFIDTSNDLNGKFKITTDMNCTTYSKYGQGCINEVICNKNILPYVEKVNYDMVTGVDYYGITYMQKVKPNTSYVLSTVDKLTSGFQLREYDKDGTYIKGTAQTLGTAFITSSKTHFIKFRTNDLVSKITNPYFMLEESKVLTDYIEHKEQVYTIPTQQPFRSIEIAKNKFLRDTFIKKNKCYERHYIPRKIFDGTENFTTVNGWGNTVYEIKIDGMLSPENNSTLGKALCSHFTIKTGSDMYYNSNVNAFAISPESLLRIRNINTTTLEDFKAYLKAQYNAGTPVYVDYVLETSLDIECTEEQSQILWDIEQNAKTYDKVTHIYSTDNVSPNVDVTYKKDIETLFANTLIEEVG